jgi:branched-chain amino acid transport system ATP-binding protein
MSAAILQVSDLAKAFDGVRAVDGVTFAVVPGELVALIGPNGAGKTTCFNLVNGQLKPDAGSIQLAGQRIEGQTPAAIARRGVGRTFQVAATFASMTVRDNVVLALLAHAGQHGAMFSGAAAEFSEQADALLARVGCRELAHTHCATLAYGNAKRVELALALAGEPRLLLMDEPTAGMAQNSRGKLMRLASTLAKRDGIAVLFTEHDMDVVFGFADRVIVLDRGRIIAEGTPAVIRADPRVQAVYLGTEAQLGSLESP